MIGRVVEGLHHLDVSVPRHRIIRNVAVDGHVNVNDHPFESRAGLLVVTVAVVTEVAGREDGVVTNLAAAVVQAARAAQAAAPAAVSRPMRNRTKNPQWFILKAKLAV